MHPSPAKDQQVLAARRRPPLRELRSGRLRGARALSPRILLRARCRAASLAEASLAHLAHPQHRQVPRVKIGLALGGLFAQGVSAWPLVSAVPPAAPVIVAYGAEPNRNWDSNTVLVYRAK